MLGTSLAAKMEAPHVLQHLLSSYIATETKLDNAQFEDCLRRTRLDQWYSLVCTLSKKGIKLTHWAVITNNKNVLSTVLKRVSPKRRFEVLNVRDDTNRTVLHWCAIGGQWETMELLLGFLPTSKEQLALLSVQDTLQRTAIHYSACAGKADTVLCVLRYLQPSQWFELLTLQTMGGCTALSWAACSNDEQILRCMMDPLTYRQQLTVLSIVNSERKTPLDVAYECNSIQAAELLEKYKTLVLELVNRPNADVEEKLTDPELSNLQRQITCLAEVVNKKDEQLKAQGQQVEKLKTDLATAQTKLRKMEQNYATLSQLNAIKDLCVSLMAQQQQQQHDITEMRKSTVESIGILQDKQQELGNQIIGTDFNVARNENEIRGLAQDQHTIDGRQLTMEESIGTMEDRLTIVEDRQQHTVNNQAAVFEGQVDNIGDNRHVVRPPEEN